MREIGADPVSGVHDGVMKRPATDPLVMQTDSETEFWQLRGSLNVRTAGASRCGFRTTSQASTILP